LRKNAEGESMKNGSEADGGGTSEGTSVRRPPASVFFSAMKHAFRQLVADKCLDMLPCQSFGR
jgi:hypothetical protein